MKLKVILFFVFLSFIGSVSNAAIVSIEPSITSFLGTKWHYKDSDWEYDIAFLDNGVLQTTHPNNRTKDDDTWVQNGDTVQFFFNNGFSSYTGRLSGNQVIGTATNKNGATWEWSATLISDNENSQSQKSYNDNSQSQNSSQQVDCEQVRQTQTVFTEVNKQANKMILNGNMGEKLYGGVLKLMYGAIPSGVEQGNSNCYPK